jgi:quaternary ammonium compound-resistance protein SugE
MAWLILICSGALEAVWAGALSASKGLTGTEPISAAKIIFLTGIILAIIGLKIIPASQPDRDETELASTAKTD